MRQAPIGQGPAAHAPHAAPSSTAQMTAPGHTPAPASSAPTGSTSTRPTPVARNPSAPRPRRRRAGLLDRAERVARIMLANTQALDWLTSDDHLLLSQTPAPLGPLFGWLESQWHEHGPQPWAALREGLRDQPFEADALDLTTSVLNVSPAAHDTAEQAADELQAELQELLRRMRIEVLKERETTLIQRASSDPHALETYRKVQTERRRLEALSASLTQTEPLD